MSVSVLRLYKDHKMPNTHDTGKAMISVLIQTHARIKTGTPIKIEKNPRTGCFHRNRSAFLSILYSYF